MISEEKLMAYADGELSAHERAEIEAAMAADPALREKVQAHIQLRAQLSGAFDHVLDEPAPERLLEATRARAPQTDNVVSLAARRGPRWSAREWGAMAASVAAGLFIGLGVMNAQAPMIAASEGGLVARGALARALDHQLAAEAAGAVRIGLSFRNQDGRFCRSFDLTERATSGVACHEDGAWALALTAASESGGEIRMAGSAPEVLAAIDAMIAGEPLDAEAEARAREAGWR